LKASPVMTFSNQQDPSNQKFPQRVSPCGVPFNELFATFFEAESNTILDKVSAFTKKIFLDDFFLDLVKNMNNSNFFQIWINSNENQRDMFIKNIEIVLIKILDSQSQIHFQRFCIPIFAQLMSSGSFDRAENLFVTLWEQYQKKDNGNKMKLVLAYLEQCYICVKNQLENTEKVNERVHKLESITESFISNMNEGDRIQNRLLAEYYALMLFFQKRTLDQVKIQKLAKKALNISIHEMKSTTVIRLFDVLSSLHKLNCGAFQIPLKENINLINHCISTCEQTLNSKTMEEFALEITPVSKSSGISTTQALMFLSGYFEENWGLWTEKIIFLSRYCEVIKDFSYDRKFVSENLMDMLKQELNSINFEDLSRTDILRYLKIFNSLNPMSMLKAKVSLLFAYMKAFPVEKRIANINEVLNLMKTIRFHIYPEMNTNTQQNHEKYVTISEEQRDALQKYIETLRETHLSLQFKKKIDLQTYVKNTNILIFIFRRLTQEEILNNQFMEGALENVSKLKISISKLRKITQLFYVSTSSEIPQGIQNAQFLLNQALECVANNSYNVSGLIMKTKNIEKELTDMEDRSQEQEELLQTIQKIKEVEKNQKKWKEEDHKWGLNKF